MRILLVVVYYPPNTTSAAKMMRDLALEFTRRGHEVFVVTPSDSIDSPTSLANEQGVTVVRVKCAKTRSVNKVLRLWRESRLSARIWKRARGLFDSTPCELVVFYSPSIFFGELVRRLKRQWDCPSYLVHRDMFPQWLVETGMIRDGSILHSYLKRKETEQYSAADIIGVEAPGNLAYFKNKLPRGSRVEVLYNWMGTPSEAPHNSAWRQSLGLEGKTVFLFGGNIGPAQDLDNIVRLAFNVRENSDAFFLIVGDGSEVSRLKLEIERLRLNNIKILPAMPQEEYFQCLSEFDVGLVSLDRRLNSSNFTGKAMGYLSYGKPILASVNPGNDLMDLLQSSGAGIACANGEDGDLRDAALLLATQSKIREQMGKNARMLADTKFSVRISATQILSHFEPGIRDNSCGIDSRHVRGL